MDGKRDRLNGVRELLAGWGGWRRRRRKRWRRRALQFQHSFC